jgi:hypothetical protein
MMTYIRQPLFHFLLAGLLIFIAYELTSPEPEVSDFPEKVIEVNRVALLNFMQFRAQAFQPALFSEQFDNMSDEEIEQLVTEYVREEALHREALVMGMDQGDYIIRQRLVQKVEFLLENMMDQAPEAESGEIETFYESRSEDYQVDAVYTFTHIFFDGEERGWDQAEMDAAGLLISPQILRITFNDVSGFGDRYPFLQNYMDRTRDFVINNFTDDFVTALDELPPTENLWQGPFESRYGFHLVMLRERTEPIIPELAQIRERVMVDWRYEKVLEIRKEAEDLVIAGYEVQIDLQAE